MGDLAIPSNDPHRAFDQMRGLDALRPFDDDQLAGLAQIAERTALYPGQVLFEEREGGDDLYVLLDGDVEAVRQTPVGEQVLAQLRSGALLGEESFLDGGPRTATVIAWFASDILRFPAPALRHLAADDHGFRLALLRTLWRALAGRIRQANGFMATIMAAAGNRDEAVTATAERVRIAPESKLAVLREKGLDAEHLDRLTATLRGERYEPEAFVFTEGEPGQTLYIVVEGQVRISRRLPGMGEEAVTMLSRGESFGELALIDGDVRSADARACECGATLLSINRERLEETLQREPAAGAQFLEYLCRLLARRLRAMTDLLVAWRTMAAFG